ncbi:hypothetical protein CEXT_53611 [Caerostris extrusa]|uniref:Uncharacterized protein n=1 Tax=Caerostris extrusa TaxID=172846 RepID=A0AAV4VP29_CAEEX|nr:hypothetical protein CEXT_53611 [Caerostris extrusa]
MFHHAPDGAQVSGPFSNEQGHPGHVLYAHPSAPWKAPTTHGSKGRFYGRRDTRIIWLSTHCNKDCVHLCGNGALLCNCYREFILLFVCSSNWRKNIYNKEFICCLNNGALHLLFQEYITFVLEVSGEIIFLKKIVYTFSGNDSAIATTRIFVYRGI